MHCTHVIVTDISCFVYHTSVKQALIENQPISCFHRIKSNGSSETMGFKPQLN